MFTKRISLLLSGILLYASCYEYFIYAQAINSMNQVIEQHNLYYKNRFNNTYIIINKTEKHLLSKLIQYNWNIININEINKNKIIMYVKPGSEARIKNNRTFKEYKETQL